MAKEFVLSSEEKAKNELLNKAIAYAVEKHWDGLRKGTDMPYIVHPLEAMHILYTMGADKYLMAAGVLHDTVEDTGATLEDIEEKFGREVRELVECHTEKDKSLPWKERKEIALAHLKTASKREKMLVLADKLANMRAINRDYLMLSDKLWERFNKGPKEQKWYYNEGVKALKELMDYEETRERYFEFSNLVDDVFGLEYDDDGILDETDNKKLLEQIGELEKEKKYEDIAKLLEKPAAEGNKLAMGMLGGYYFFGTGVEQGQARAIPLLTAAAEVGYIIPIRILGKAYYYGDGVEQDFTLAREYLEELEGVEGGEDAEVLTLLGHIYEDGMEIPPDVERACELYQKAADEDYPPAQYDFGMCLLNGDGCEADEKQACEYLQKASQAGYDLAYDVYGLLLMHGIGCQENAIEGVEWIKKGAEADNPQALFNLARCYAEGIGTKKNMKEAERLQKLAEELVKDDPEEFVEVKSKK